MKTCKCCKHWGHGRKDAESRLKSCSAPLIEYGYGVEESKVADSGAMVEDDEGLGMVTGPEFGCVLHEEIAVRELSGNEVDLFVDQLEETAAALGVILGDIDQYASDETKKIITDQLKEIFGLLRAAEQGDLTTSFHYKQKLEKFWERKKSHED
ncbi:hypothetical protein SKTS_13410 [Sulfurimicrobium lacus]|uniref:Uncharacterized protein n=1 Tax=Sulfurimicrobium lacus TaxID=2715678 RepID=A0A6F8VCH0_9PROT|nr:hypothetical protein [Sulfurimicrobium lacus]BCB26455.1 hypothetical protein SKTS_13410 [Sulfurimicrobium lacus]